MKKIFFLITTFFLTTNFANATEWKIVPEKSKIEFKATQNDSAVTGSFKKFSGKINFDPAQLKNSKVVIDIDTTSVESSLSDATSTLKTVEWLSTKAFPQANFSAEKFTKISDKKFSADGKLTIKGKSIAVKFDFTLEEYSTTNARAVGTVVIKRNDFAIGAPDPANAHGVKNEVAVSFVINAIK